MNATMKTMMQTVNVRTITGPDALHDLLDQGVLIQLDGHHQGCKTHKKGLIPTSNIVEYAVL